MTNNITQAEDWREWKEKCAYQLCSEDAQARLGKFGCLRFKKYCSEGKTHKLPKGELSKLLSSLMVDSSGDLSTTLFEKKVWQHFDTSIILKKKGNKSIKNWMAARGRTLQDFEREASYAFRDAVREYVRIERGKPGWRTNDSLDRLVGDGKDSLTLGKMTESDSPRPDEEALDAELAEELPRRAKAFFDGLSEDRKIAFVAKALRLSLDHPKVKGLAKKGKSVLSSNWKTDVDAFVEQLAQDETLRNAGMTLLEQVALPIMEKIAIEWAEKPENGCTELLKERDE